MFFASPLSVIALLPVTLIAWDVLAGVSINTIFPPTIAQGTKQAYCGCETAPSSFSFRRYGGVKDGDGYRNSRPIDSASLITVATVTLASLIALATTAPSKTFNTTMTNDFCLDTNPNGLTCTGSLRPNCICTDAVIANGGLDVINGNFRAACDCSGYQNNGFMIGSTNASFYKPACGTIYDWSQFGKGAVYVDRNAL